MPLTQSARGPLSCVEARSAALHPVLGCLAHTLPGSLERNAGLLLRFNASYKVTQRPLTIKDFAIL